MKKPKKAPKRPPAPVEETRDPRLLKPYEKNARRHPPEQVEQLARSFEEFGFIGRILVDEDDEIIAGHGRQEAAMLAGLKEVPVLVARGWTDAQKRAYRLLDNKLAENSEWDEELLKLELTDLEDDAFDVSLLGFSTEDLGRLFGDTGEGGAAGAGGEIEDPPESAYQEQYGVIVLCRDEAEQRKTYEALTAQGFTCRVVTT